MRDPRQKLSEHFSMDVDGVWYKKTFFSGYLIGLQMDIDQGVFVISKVDPCESPNCILESSQRETLNMYAGFSRKDGICITGHLGSSLHTHIIPSQYVWLKTRRSRVSCL